MKNLFLTFCGCIVSVLLMAQQTDEERLAVQFYQNGEYEKAEELFFACM